MKLNRATICNVCFLKTGTYRHPFSPQQLLIVLNCCHKFDVSPFVNRILFCKGNVSKLVKTKSILTKFMCHCTGENKGQSTAGVLANWLTEHNPIKFNSHVWFNVMEEKHSKSHQSHHDHRLFICSSRDDSRWQRHLKAKPIWWHRQGRVALMNKGTITFIGIGASFVFLPY